MSNGVRARAGKAATPAHDEGGAAAAVVWRRPAARAEACAAPPLVFPSGAARKVTRGDDAAPPSAESFTHVGGARLGRDFGLVRTRGSSPPPPIQTKLVVGRHDDAYEQEADRVAAQVVSMPAARAGGERPAGIRAGSAPAAIRRACAACAAAKKDEDEHVIRAKSGGGHAPTPTPEFGERLGAARGGGRPLAAGERSFFEPRFGHDFSRVRVHTGETAAHMARSIDARAFTSGQDIFVGAGQYDPSSERGRKLMAHELTHVVQQAPHIARAEAEEESCLSGHREYSSESLNPPLVLDGTRYHYRIWGTLRQGENSDTLAVRVLDGWMRRQFGPLSPAAYKKMMSFAVRNLTDGQAIPLVPACQYFMPVNRAALAHLLRLSGAVAREKAKEARKDEEAAKPAESAQPAETPAPGEGTTTPGTPPAKGERTAVPPAPKAVKGEPDEKKAEGEPKGDLAGLAGAVEEAKRLSTQPALRKDWDVLKDSKLAANYLDVLQHYAGRALTPEDTAAAADGLTEEELTKITAGKPLLRVLTDLYTQGYGEFKAAGGSDQEEFFRLEEMIVEQFTRGNPTATHNYLKIGYGVPEKEVLGIVQRSTGILYYDDRPQPLPGRDGGVRDKGYIATRPDKDQFDINIAAIGDPGLRLFLTSLKQNFGDPVVVTDQAAVFYLNNIKLVSAEVQKGLAAETREKFQEMLGPFILFLAGHALSTFLMAAAYPPIAALGLALKGFLLGWGYVMNIEFGAGALSKLLDAAYHLTRIEVDEAKKMTRLSEKHLAAAAEPLRQMAADIALMSATHALGKILRQVQKGERKARIDCTECELKGGAGEKLAEAKAEGKAAEAKPEGKAAEAKPEAKAGPAPRPPEVTAAINELLYAIGFDRLPSAQQQRFMGKLEAFLELRKQDQLAALTDFTELARPKGIPRRRSSKADDAETWLDYLNAGRRIMGRAYAALQAELSDMLIKARTKSQIIRGPSSSGDVEGGTFAVAKSNVPQLANMTFEGASPRAGGRMPAKPAFESPSPHGSAQGHAEHVLVEDINRKLEDAIAADPTKNLKPEDIEGTIWVHVEQEVCPNCSAGLLSEAQAGVLKQFSLKFRKITLEITAEGTNEVIVVRNGTSPYKGETSPDVK